MGIVSSSHKDAKLENYNFVLSASALCAILFVSGFCWLFYYICKRSNDAGKGFGNASKMKHRKASVTSVPGDPNGHYYKPPTNPQVYLDTSGLSRASTAQLVPIPSLPTIPGYLAKDQSQYFPPQYFQQAHRDLEEQLPPPYPGQQCPEENPEGKPEGFVYSILTENGHADLPKLPPPYST